MQRFYETDLAWGFMEPFRLVYIGASWDALRQFAFDGVHKFCDSIVFNIAHLKMAQ